MDTAAVLLAAGAGSRFAGGTHKLRALHAGRPLVARAIEAAVESGIGPVFVVTGAEPLEDLIPAGVTEVRADRWSAGQAHSLAAATAVAESLRLDAMVVGLADMPGVTAACWSAVAESGSPIAVASYAGHRRPPVRLASGVWAELPDSGDEGARELMRRRPELVEEVPVAGDGHDIDTVEDLRNLA